MLVIREEDVKSVLTMETCISALEEVYKALGSGEGVVSPRQNLWVAPPKSIKLAAAALPPLGFMGVTAYTGGYGPKGSGPSTTLLYSSKDGELLAHIQSKHISWYRTGATSAVATKFLGAKNSELIGIIGSGRQARTQLLGLCAVLPKIKRINVYSLTREHREKFATEMTSELGVPVIPSETAESCVRGADVIATVTTSKQPVLKHDWLKNGVHICAIGAHYPDAREIDSDTVTSSKVVVDSREQALLEKGELLIAIKEKRLSQDIIYAELGEIVLRKKPGRVSQEENTLFCSGGLSIEQVGIAIRVYEAAVKKGLGLQVGP
jgi:alanine dehydrogenase